MQNKELVDILSNNKLKIYEYYFVEKYLLLKMKS